MAQLPTIASTAGRRDLPSARLDVQGVTPGAFGAQIGQGIEQLGDAGADVGRAVQQFQQAKIEEQNRLAEFDRQTQFVNFGSDQATKLDEAKRNLSGPAQDFTKTTMAGFDTDAATFLQAVPERERHAWTARMASLRQGVAGDALRAEFAQRDAYYKTTIDSTLSQLQNGAMQSPDKMGEWLAQGQQIIEASGLSAEDKLEYGTRWKAAVSVAAATGDVMRDPEGAIQRLGGLDHTTKFEAESKVPNSAGAGSAPGGQYVNGYAPRKRNGGDNTDAAVDGYISSLSRDLGIGADAPVTRAMLPQLAAAMTKVESGGKVSARSTRNNNPGNIEDGKFAKAQPGYAGSDGRFAKFDTAASGAAAQQSLLGKYLARGQTTIRSIIEGVPAKGAAGQPQSAAPVSAGGAASGVSLGHPDDLPPVDPRYADLPFDTRQQLIGSAQREIDRRQAVQVAAQQQAHSDWYNQFMNDLNDGKAGTADIEAARKSGQLTDFDEISRAQNVVEQRDKKGAALNLYNAMISGNATFNPYDDNTKAAVNAAFDQQAKVNGANPFSVAMNIWQRTGVLPEQGGTMMRGALVSTDANRVAAAASVASNMIQRNPNAFAGVAGGNDIEQAATLYNHYVNDLGMNAQDAAKAVAARNAPEAKRRFDANKPALDAFRKDLRAANVESTLGAAFGSWFDLSRDPRFTSPEQRGAAMQDYADFALQNFEQTGDEKAANAYALQQMKKLYGTVNGRLMKYPPTRAYPPVMGSHDYIFDQAREDIKTATGRDIPTDKIYLMPIPSATAEAFRAGKPTPYSIHYIDKVQGQDVYRVINGQAFVADVPSAQAAGKAKFDAEQAERRKRDASVKAILESRGAMGTFN